MAIRTGRVTEATRPGVKGGIVVEGVNAVARVWQRKAITMPAEAGAAVVKAAGRAAERMRQRVPVRSRKTQQSITADRTPSIGEGGVYADAGPTWFVARFLERGTVKMSPRPFVRPATDETIPELVRELGRIAREV